MSDMNDYAAELKDLYVHAHIFIASISLITFLQRIVVNRINIAIASKLCCI